MKRSPLQMQGILPDVTLSRQSFIHINGYINRLNEATFYEEFKITDENYNRDGLLQSTWRQLFDLLVKGDLKTKFISQKWYCIHRNEMIEETMDWLSQKKVVILQSKLGNGKSVFLECLAYYLLEKYNVYMVKNLDSYIEDLQLVQNMMTEEERQMFIEKAFEMTEKYWEYFNVKELSETPIEVETAYREYRRLFYNTPYMLPLKKYDQAYNLKIRRKKFRIKF